MNISKVFIENYKCFKGKFCLELNPGLNIIVGNNEAGKSTILEAIHLALTGYLNGRYLKNELNQYIFNNEVVNEYLTNLQKNDSRSPAVLPYILIEVFLQGEDLSAFEGDGNSEKRRECGISFKIAFDEKNQQEYESLIKSKSIKSIPVEYYDIFWKSCARENITARSIPLKSALIDSSSYRYQNGSDIYISRIIRDNLDVDELIGISQAYREMKEAFMEKESVKAINNKIKSASKISEKEVKLSIDLSSKNAWETSLMTYLNDVPFHFVGRGEQCIIKTNLALDHKKSREANVILLEEPENHLSHSKMNELIRSIKDDCQNKQILISTHSSFVANKLGLENLIILENKKPIRLNDLKLETRTFFKRLSGYDTLRMILCDKAILVEGDSDELIIQKAFRLNNEGKLPIERGIDVISVGTSFLRFLEIADKIKKSVVVVTDNDGDLDALKSKYQDYLCKPDKAHIKICFDTTIDRGNLEINGVRFNYNTLEPKLLKSNDLEKFNKIFSTNYKEDDELLKYMKHHKTECALKLFETTESVNFPQYILNAID